MLISVNFELGSQPVVRKMAIYDSKKMLSIDIQHLALLIGCSKRREGFVSEGFRGYAQGTWLMMVNLLIVWMFALQSRRGDVL